MSLSITFQQFNIQKVDEAWEKIIRGEIQGWIIEQTAALNQVIQEVKIIPLLPDDDFEFYQMDYHDKKTFSERSRATQQRRRSEKSLEQLQHIDGKIKTLLGSIDAKNDVLLKKRIREIDQVLAYFFDDASFNEDLGWYVEVLDALFAKTVGQKFTDFTDTSVIPQEVWIRAFRGITVDVMKSVVAEVSRRLNTTTTLEEMVEYLQPIRAVLKHCIDTGSRMIVTVEGEKGDGFFTERAEMTLAKFKTARTTQGSTSISMD